MNQFIDAGKSEEPSPGKENGSSDVSQRHGHFSTERVIDDGS